MKTILKRLFTAALTLTVLLPCLSRAEEEIETIVTIVEAPDQTEAQRPPCFPDPADNFIPLPEGVNLAERKPVASGEHADVYVDTNINDGKTDTYWESKGFPAEVVFDLQGEYTVSAAAVLLNPSSIWEPRTQEIAVQVSLDGERFTEAAALAKYDFNAETGNRIRIDFDPTQAAYVKIIFTLNTASRSMGAQAAEICIYE